MKILAQEASSFLFLVVRPGAPSSVLAPAMPFVTSSFLYIYIFISFSNSLQPTSDGLHVTFAIAFPHRLLRLRMARVFAYRPPSAFSEAPWRSRRPSRCKYYANTSMTCVCLEDAAVIAASRFCFSLCVLPACRYKTRVLPLGWLRHQISLYRVLNARTFLPRDPFR